MGGPDRRCPPEGPDGVQVKCKNRLKLGGNSLIITNNFGPGFKRKTTATDPHFTNFKSVRSWSGGCDPRSIMITVTELQNNSAPTRKKAAPPPFLSLDYLPSSGRLSSPGHKSLLAHFFVSKTTEHDEGGAR